jgi:hypothetical protein
MSPGGFILIGNGSTAREEGSSGGDRGVFSLMASRQGTPSLVMSAFPGRDALIERAYRESGSFRDLCADYRKCAAAVERWRRSGGVSCARAGEYTELLDELAAEIEAWLDAVAVSATPLSEGGGQ